MTNKAVSEQLKKLGYSKTEIHQLMNIPQIETLINGHYWLYNLFNNHTNLTFIASQEHGIEIIELLAQLQKLGIIILSSVPNTLIHLLKENEGSLACQFLKNKITEANGNECGIETLATLPSKSEIQNYEDYEDYENYIENIRQYNLEEFDEAPTVSLPYAYTKPLSPAAKTDLISESAHSIEIPGSSKSEFQPQKNAQIIPAVSRINEVNGKIIPPQAAADKSILVCSHNGLSFQFSKQTPSAAHKTHATPNSNQTRFHKKIISKKEMEKKREQSFRKLDRVQEVVLSGGISLQFFKQVKKQNKDPLMEHSFLNTN